MCCQCCFQNITWSHQLIKGKNSACTLPMCVMKSDSRIIHVMICLKQYWQLKTLITILSQYAHSDTHGLMNQSHSTQGKTCQQVYSSGHRQDIVWLKLRTSISMFIVHQSVWNICTHTAYNVHKTHNKSLSSRDVNSSGGGESLACPADRWRCRCAWGFRRVRSIIGNSQWRSGRLPGIPWLCHAAAGCR